MCCDVGADPGVLLAPVAAWFCNPHRDYRRWSFTRHFGPADLRSGLAVYPKNKTGPRRATRAFQRTVTRLLVAVVLAVLAPRVLRLLASLVVVLHSFRVLFIGVNDRFSAFA